MELAQRRHRQPRRRRSADVADGIRLLALLLLVVLALALVGAARSWLSPDRRTHGDRARDRDRRGRRAARRRLRRSLRSIAIDHVEGPDEPGRPPARSGTPSSATCAPTAWILAGCGRGDRRGRRLADQAARPFGRPSAAGGRLDRRASPRARRCGSLRGVALRRGGRARARRTRRGPRAAAHASLGVYLIYEGVSAILRLVYRRRPASEHGASRRRGGGRPATRSPPPSCRPWSRALVIAIAIAGRSPVAGKNHDRRSRPPVSLQRAPGSCATSGSTSWLLPGHPPVHGGPAARLVRGRAGRTRRRPAARRRPSGVLIDAHYVEQLPDGRGPYRDRERSRSCASSRRGRGRCRPRRWTPRYGIRDRLVHLEAEGERGMYLCHTFCEIGRHAARLPCSTTSATSSWPIPTK